MKSRIGLLVMVALAFASSGGRAAVPAPKLTPGSSFTITFPEMPPTFYSVFQKQDVKAQMKVFLPRNYEPARKHPLLIFLGGWDGGIIGSPGVACSLSEGRDFICVGMPLFKAPDFNVAKANTPGDRFIMDATDGKYMWPYFKTMLEKLDVLVPNIAPAHRVLGGFSNGAHATACLIDESDGEVTRRFSAFLIVEGGGKMKRFELLKGKPYLMVSSNAKSRPRAQQICDTAKAAGAKTTFILYDVGKHDFPILAYPAVREWLRGPAME